MNDSLLFWLFLAIVSATVILYAAIAVRAFLFKPPVTLGLATLLAAAWVAYNQVQVVGLGLAAIVLPVLIGWQIYYVVKDWQSRDLRLLVTGFLVCAAVTAGLYFR